MRGFRTFLFGAFVGGLAVWFLGEHPGAVEDGWRAARDFFRTEKPAAHEIARDLGRATQDAADRVKDSLGRGSSGH
ncbi:MAG: hypothetical protein KC466_01115 [Myxococcales bacterium]|nr:hypothetical protein [Myxococcales bacterium]